jgi:hypothetical protein
MPEADLSVKGEDRQVPPPKSLDADRLFYHYLQRELQTSDIWLFQMLTARLVVALGVWIHPSIYEQLPIMVPYAVRDPKCRGNKAAGIPDAWGSPDGSGLFRDDNSLVKGLPRSLTISSPSALFDGRRIGRGFVAAHVWRELTSEGLASRNPLTYSFVPNLVWLPSEVAALTDREGSFVQTYTQALAMKIYRHHPVAGPLAEIAERAWDLLPAPTAIPEQGLPDIESLNYFRPNATWVNDRYKKIMQVADALTAVSAGATPTGKIISDRYTQGLPSVAASAAKKLASSLQAFAAT